MGDNFKAILQRAIMFAINAIGLSISFLEKHWEERLKFSRRTPRQLDQWAARYGYKDHPKEILDHAKKGNGRGRREPSCLQ